MKTAIQRLIQCFLIFRKTLCFLTLEFYKILIMDIIVWEAAGVLLAAMKELLIMESEIRQNMDWLDCPTTPSM